MFNLGSSAQEKFAEEEDDKSHFPLFAERILKFLHPADCSINP